METCNHLYNIFLLLSFCLFYLYCFSQSGFLFSKKKYCLYWHVSYMFSLSGIQVIISASPNVEITSPGHRASGYFNSCKLVCHLHFVIGEVGQFILLSPTKLHFIINTCKKHASKDNIFFC
jgi:hypothetical protein